MNIKIYAKNKEKIPCLKNKILKINSKTKFTNKPDVVICFGGDGTLLHAERLHEGVPKLVIKDGSICKTCNTGNLGAILKKFFKGEYIIKTEPKLEAKTKNQTLIATNDVVIRNADQHHAIRFEIKTNNKTAKAIGDGVVISTAFGSTAYYNSITRTTFKEGIGIAFNNTTEEIKPINTKNKITFVLKRNKAYITSDNKSKKITLSEGDAVVVQRSKQTIKIIQIKK